MKRSVSEAKFIADFVCGGRGRNIGTLYGPDMVQFHPCSERPMFWPKYFDYSDGVCSLRSMLSSASRATSFVIGSSMGILRNADICKQQTHGIHTNLLSLVLFNFQFGETVILTSNPT
jgi:hypothetical protein